jgi:cobalt-zinc-cadmium efflux system membrane fusion protein
MFPRVVRLTALGVGLAGLWTAPLACGTDEGSPEAARETGRDEEHAEEAHRGEEEAEGEEAVRLAPEVLAEFGIEVATAGPGPIERTIALPAEVRPNQDLLAHVAPRFPGIAREVRAQIGDAVKEGQVLAIIESEALAPYPLKTQIEGVVIAKHVTVGEPVSSDRDAFTVADLRQVWVDVSVYQNHLRDVRLGQSALISAGHGLDEARGKISYVSPVVDEETRTAVARVVLGNPDGVWRPGLFVTARITVERAEAPIAVPRTALEVVEGKTVVFVEGEHGFAARPVTLGRQDGLRVEVQGGLAPGERYVAKGGFTLKAELARGEMRGGHSH